MNFLRKLFGGNQPASDGAVHLYVKCKRCGAPVHARVDLRNELVPEYGDGDEIIGYKLTKEMMDSRCFQLMRAEITYDRQRRETNRTIDGGTFITQEEYDQLIAAGAHERKIS
ncbi:MAG: hypothetical protein AAGF95_16565 [Chloroflexota bacterium]